MKVTMGKNPCKMRTAVRRGVDTKTQFLIWNMKMNQGEIMVIPVEETDDQGGGVFGDQTQEGLSPDLGGYAQLYPPHQKMVSQSNMNI